MVVLSNLPPPTEGIRFQQPQTVAILQNQNLGEGTLYIAESCVSWLGVGGQGFSLQYPAISLHAVSRDQSTYPEECLYVMLETPASVKRRRKRCLPQICTEQMASQMAALSASDSTNQREITGAQAPTTVNGDDNNGENGAEEEDEEDTVSEIRFIPADKTTLEEIFKAMSECQTLHPDEEDDFSDEEGTEFYEAGDGEWFTAPEDGDQLNEEGQAVLQRIMASHGDGMEVDAEDSMETGQFEDPPEQ